MLAYTREKLLTLLLQANNIVNLYQSNDPLFTGRVITWLNEVEQTLQHLRLPISSLASAERAKLIATGNGFREVSLSGKSVSNQKAQKIAAVVALDRVQAELRIKTSEIDKELIGLRERMAQFIAVVVSKVPIPLPPTDPRSNWLTNIWKNWNVNGETQNMYNYLNSIMSSSDRIYLLDELITNLISEVK